MPITPLHFGLIPLLNRATRRRMSESAFVFANVITDIPVVRQIYAAKVREYGAPESAYPFHTLHDNFSHNFIGALCTGALLELIGLGLARFRAEGWRWLLGCVLGTLTHVALDMFVHHDVQPFAPWIAGNPFYMDGAHGALSIVLCVGLAFWALDSRDRHRLVRQLTADEAGVHQPKSSWWR